MNNFFMRDFKSELIRAAINHPGNWYDSQLAAASGLYRPLLSSKTRPGFYIFGNSAFPHSAPVFEEKILTERKENEYGEGNSVPRSILLAAVNFILNPVIPSERQSA